MAWRRWFRFKGVLKREVGHATGDRRTEAEGRVEAGLGKKPDDRTFHVVERAVRRAHHDIPDPTITSDRELERVLEHKPGRDARA